MSLPSTTRSRLPGLVLVLAGLLALPLMTAVGQAAAAPVIGDAGAFVRWGLLYAKFVQDLAAAATVGLLVHAAFLVPETTRTHRRLTATRAAAVTAALWAVSGVAGAVLSMADLIGIPVSDPSFGRQFMTFAFSLEQTRVILIMAIGAAVVAAGALLARGRVAMVWLAGLSIASLLPLALTGHAAGSDNHATAVNALAVHLIAVSVWVGGVLALAITGPTLGRDLGPTARRFSVLAVWCYGAVAASGVLSATLRLGGWGDLLTRYGALILVKSVALVVLGYAGWRHRRSLLPRLDGDRSTPAFVRLLVAELAVMGVAIGTAVALARSAPPARSSPVGDASPAFALTGYPAPPPFDASSWFTTWRTDWLWLGVAVVAVALYLGGVLRLRRRGDSWPIHRPILWVLGWAVFAYATCGAPGVYGAVMFSAHMVMHMVIAMMVPLLLVPAAPVLLALRTLAARTDKTWGPRELILQVVHSRFLRWFSNPIVAAALFFLSLVVFYYSPLFELALRTHTGHVLMIVHFLLTGYLFTWVLVGIDPGPKKWPPLMLLVILFATMSFHAFFGVVMTGSTTQLAPGFFDVIHLPWMTQPLQDQHTAGAIAWGIGEAPTVMLTLMVVIAWVRSDRAETERSDRQADRDGGAELLAYNARLAQLKQRSERRS
ncbi:MAG TPA: cytochrome c oxidase assembly protein [Pedococcus sp.]|nr:cytochrome c oxidase assembly protein [Pedococcus sp.]